MTVERSKRRFLIPIVFITKCSKKPLLLFERTFKMMQNGVYFIAVALLVAKLFKILI